MCKKPVGGSLPEQGPAKAAPKGCAPEGIDRPIRHLSIVMDHLPPLDAACGFMCAPGPPGRKKCL
jgi:hypothetical protein